MKILVGWEPSPEVETLELMLNVGGHDAIICRHGGVFLNSLEDYQWDVVLLSLDFPSAQESMDLFQSTQQAL